MRLCDGMEGFVLAAAFILDAVMRPARWVNHALLDDCCLVSSSNLRPCSAVTCTFLIELAYNYNFIILPSKMERFSQKHPKEINNPCVKHPDRTIQLSALVAYYY